MLQPVGPLPSQVYWRRRLVVAGGLAVLALVGVAMCSSGGPVSGTPGGGAALTGSGTPTASTTTTGEITITPPPGSAGGPAQGPQPSHTASGGGPGSTGTAPPTTNAPITTAAPEPCPDAALTVVAGSAKPAYRVGETPVLKLTVRNTGSVSCVRDVGPRQQEMLLYAGSTRIWSSNDCYPDGGTDVRTLSPGESIGSTVVWSGLSSQPGCAGTRTRVKAGSYDLVARVGGARSKPVKLILQ